MNTQKFMQCAENALTMILFATFFTIKALCCGLYFANLALQVNYLGHCFILLFMIRLVLTLIFSLNLGLATQAFADEILSQNAAGVTLYSADDATANYSAAYESEPSNANTETSASWQAKTQEVLMKAFSLTGIKYTWGGKTPETGFDCSGFVSYVFRNAVNLTLPATARAISQIGKTVKKGELQPGDLVFFNTLKSAFSHVGIYIGDNKFIHAPRTGAAVRVENMQNGYWASRFNGGQRLDSEAEKAASN